jgi:hypothetical protein
MGNPSERAVKMLGDIRVNCSVCGKSTHLGDLYVIDGWPACVDCVDKADDADCVEDEIFTVCAGCEGLIGERDECTYYAGRNWCTDCIDEAPATDSPGRDDCAGCPWVEPTFALCASCSVNTG